MTHSFYKQPYLKELDVKVVRIDGNNVFFNDTIFYAEGGGQPGDIGFFNDYEIVDTKKEDGEIAHVFSSVKGLSVGSEGHLKLDWTHRYSFMKRHSAQHLLSSVFYKSFNLSTVAVHLAKEYITIELSVKDVSLDTLFSVEKEANDLVRRGLKIEQKDLKREDAEALHMRRSIKVSDDVVKVVFIEGQDRVACGGVHVRSTNEIGEISYYDYEILRGHIRTIWKIDDEAEKERRDNLFRIKDAVHLLSATEGDVIRDLKARLEELEKLRKEIRDIQNRVARKEALSIDADYCVVSSEYPLDEFRTVLSKENKRKDVLIVRVLEKNEFLYIGNEEHFSILKNCLSLNGGGRGGLYQGSYSMRAEDMIAKAKEVLDGFKG